MPAEGESFLSKVLDDGSTMAIREFGINETDFASQTERNVFQFIVDYASSNGNTTPDYRTVIEQEPDFYYREGVTDNYRYLTKEIKSYAAKRKVADMFAGNPDRKGRPTTDTVEDIVNKKDGNMAIEDLISQLESIKMETGVRKKVGTDLKKDTAKLKAEYERRKEGESYRVWNSAFDFINKAAGGYVASNVYVPYGKSGRGKSAITLREALGLAEQGATVLIWAMEMGWFELFVRIFTNYSRMVGNVATATIQGVDMDIGFNSSDIRHGKLAEDFEDKFYEFIENINETLAGDIIVRGVDDDDFEERTLNQLESDVIQTEADVVVIDPFYYLDYEKNTSNTTGGDAANTSKKIRRLAGSTQTVIFAITQAEETEEHTDEDGGRELELPQRKDVKKTKQLLEDAALLIAVDTDYRDGRGMIGLNKGRDGGEGESAEIVYLPQYGIIKELTADETELMDAVTNF